MLNDLWSKASNISLTFSGRRLENRKTAGDFGFQIAKFANRLRSATNRFDNCPARSTKPRAIHREVGLLGVLVSPTPGSSPKAVILSSRNNNQ